MLVRNIMLKKKENPIELEMIQRRLIERERIGPRSYIERNGNERSYKQEVLQQLHLIITTTLEKEAASFCKEEAIKFSFYKAQTFKWPSSNSENSTGCIRV